MIISFLCFDDATPPQENLPQERSTQPNDGIARRIAKIFPESAARTQTFAALDDVREALRQMRQTVFVVLALRNVEDFIAQNSLFFDEIESCARAALLVFVAPRPNAVAENAAALRRVLQAGANAALPLDCSDAKAREVIERQIRRLRAIEQEIERAAREIALKISTALPHEFRTPLNGLIGFISLLRQGVLPEEDKETAYKFLESSVNRLHQTAEKFLLYAELERLDSLGDREHTLALRKFAIYGFGALCAEIAHETADLFDRLADIRIEIGDNEGAAQMCAQHARFILSELIANACKFSERGSPIECVLRRDGDAYAFTVRDGGWGMSDEEIRSIGVFNQFGREEREQQGIGFGLAIVRKIASLYGGSLRIESATAANASERGTTVTVVVPAAPLSQTEEEYVGVEYITMHPIG